MAEHMLEQLQERLARKEEHFETFKEVARMELQRRRGFLEWLFRR